MWLSHCRIELQLHRVRVLSSIFLGLTSLISFADVHTAWTRVVIFLFQHVLTAARPMLQAEAFASAFVMAETCQCEITLSTDVSVFDSIWVEAVVNAYAETCVGAL